ncbi:MAG: hypothetical protein AAFX44_13745 [Pseudomonadota bacterium]
MKYVTLVGMLAAMLLAPQNGSAAFCALRDPVQAINSLYPDSVGYKSIVRSIGADTRAAVDDRLSFTLHFNELGRHTLYVPVDDTQRPIGIVHVRSELVGRSLVEITWSMSLDYEIVGMEFQRCRSVACRSAAISQLNELLRGKTLAEIEPLLAKLPATLKQIGVDVDSQEAAMVEASLRSAMKTLAVTEVGWHEDIGDLQSRALVNEYLGLADPDFELQRIAVTADALLAVGRELNGDTIVDRPSIRAQAVLRDGQEVARVVHARWRDGDDLHRFRWLIGNDGEILGIEPQRPWPASDVESSFEFLIGETYRDKESCGSAAELAAFELTFVTAPANR